MGASQRPQARWLQISPAVSDRRYIVDFFCIRAKLAIELDGGQHLDAANAEYDAQRTVALSQREIRVLRFDDPDVLRDPDVVLETIYNALVEPSPQPSPGVPGEGVNA